MRRNPAGRARAAESPPKPGGHPRVKGTALVLMRSVRVVIADDTDLIRRVLRDQLVDVNCEIVGEARDGEEAVRLAQELAPDVVVMDYQMPNKTGLQATREIKQQLPHIDVIGYTSSPHHESETQMLRAGAAASYDKLDISKLVNDLAARARETDQARPAGNT